MRNVPITRFFRAAFFLCTYDTTLNQILYGRGEQKRTPTAGADLGIAVSRVESVARLPAPALGVKKLRISAGISC